METFELRYFLGVAQEENIHRASEKLRVSPGSLSKAVQRLEDELKVTLFVRKGRNIQLTDHGKLLEKRASEIIQLEEATRLEVGGHAGVLRVVIAGPEILLSEMGITLTAKIKSKFPLSTFEYHSSDDEEALDQVIRGEAHLALVTADIPAHQKLASQFITDAYFQTYAGKGHPLYHAAKTKKTVPIAEVLKFAFASPSHSLLGKVGSKQSLDGWRDDQFPRKVDYLASSLSLLQELAVKGQALVYLPDYYGERLNLEMLKISGCPYSCSQKVKMVARNIKDHAWLNQLFS